MRRWLLRLMRSPVAAGKIYTTLSANVVPSRLGPRTGHPWLPLFGQLGHFSEPGRSGLDERSPKGRRRTWCCSQHRRRRERHGECTSLRHYVEGNMERNSMVGNNKGILNPNHARSRGKTLDRMLVFCSVTLGSPVSVRLTYLERHNPCYRSPSRHEENLSSNYIVFSHNSHVKTHIDAACSFFSSPTFPPGP